MGIASLGGATLDNEENYLIKKLFTALGALQIENQARIDTAPRFPVWEPPSVAAGRRTTSKTSSTRTSSSSWARTWPRPIRSGSSG